MAHWPFQFILRFMLKSGEIIIITLTISSGFIELVLSPGPSVKPELSLSINSIGDVNDEND